MKKTIKWISIIVGNLIVIIILALLIVPMFIDVQKYKPDIEKVCGLSRKGLYRRKIIRGESKAPAPHLGSNDSW